MLTFDYERFGLTAGHLVLDAGCGAGRHTFEALYRGARTVALDLDDASLKDVAAMAGSLLEAEQSAGRFLAVHGSVNRLPFTDGTFDRVIASEILEHLPADRLAVGELARVLKRGGKAVVTVPRFWPERVCWALSEDYHSNDGGHVRIYKRSELLSMLRDSGLEILSLGHAHALHSPYWWMKCALGDSAIPRSYHRFLVWDLKRKPRFLRALERCLNPAMGKSLVVYARKP